MSTKSTTALAAGVLALTGCGVSVGSTHDIGPSVGVALGSPPAISKDKLGQEISEKLAAQVGQTPKSVVCPENLLATVGATVTCVLTAEDGTRFTVDATAYEVDGTDIKFHIQVADTPLP